MAERVSGGRDGRRFHGRRLGLRIGLGGLARGAGCLGRGVDGVGAGGKSGTGSGSGGSGGAASITRGGAGGISRVGRAAADFACAEAHAAASGPSNSHEPDVRHGRIPFSNAGERELSRLREHQAELRPPPGRRLHLDLAVVQLDDAEDHRQADAAALLLGGEVEVEDASAGSPAGCRRRCLRRRARPAAATRRGTRA